MASEQYRWVEAGEVLQEGDEYLTGERWKPTEHAGEPALLGMDYRRRVEADLPATPIPDPVNSPPHYNKFPVEVIQLTRNLSFDRGNAVKYICRAGVKDPANEVQDLKKAIWYLEDEIQRLTGEGSHAKP